MLLLVLLLLLSLCCEGACMLPWCAPSLCSARIHGPCMGTPLVRGLLHHIGGKVPLQLFSCDNRLRDVLHSCKRCRLSVAEPWFCTRPPSAQDCHSSRRRPRCDSAPRSLFLVEHHPFQHLSFLCDHPWSPRLAASLESPSNRTAAGLEHMADMP